MQIVLSPPPPPLLPPSSLPSLHFLSLYSSLPLPSFFRPSLKLIHPLYAFPPPCLATVIIDGPSSGTTMAGEQVVITCNVSPGVAVMWSRQDNQSLPNPPDGNTLRIPDPQPEDSGVYECSAGGVVALFTLMVEPPSTEPPPTTRE